MIEQPMNHRGEGRPAPIALRLATLEKHEWPLCTVHPPVMQPEPLDLGLTRKRQPPAHLLRQLRMLVPRDVLQQAERNGFTPLGLDRFRIVDTRPEDLRATTDAEDRIAAFGSAGEGAVETALPHEVQVVQRALASSQDDEVGFE